MTPDLLLFYVLMSFMAAGIAASVVGAIIELRPKRQDPPIDWRRYEGQPHDATQFEVHD